MVRKWSSTTSSRESRQQLSIISEMTDSLFTISEHEVVVDDSSPLEVPSQSSPFESFNDSSSEGDKGPKLPRRFESTFDDIEQQQVDPSVATPPASLWFDGPRLPVRLDSGVASESCPGDESDEESDMDYLADAIGTALSTSASLSPLTSDEIPKPPRRRGSADLKMC